MTTPNAAAKAATKPADLSAIKPAALTVTTLAEVRTVAGDAFAELALSALSLRALLDDQVSEQDVNVLLAARDMAGRMGALADEAAQACGHAVVYGSLADWTLDGFGNVLAAMRAGVAAQGGAQ